MFHSLDETMIDPELAQQATALIAPFLPYLMNPAVSAGKDAAVKALGGKFKPDGIGPPVYGRRFGLRPKKFRKLCR